MSTEVNPKSSLLATIYHLSATRYRTILRISKNRRRKKIVEEWNEKPTS